MGSFYQKYWTQFISELEKKSDFPLKSKKAPENNWMAWACFGRPGFKLIVSINENADWLCVNFGIDARDQKHHFQALKERKDIIEKSFGSGLRWYPMENERSNTQAIFTLKNVGVKDSLLWNKQHSWLLDHLEKMYFAFEPQVSALPNS